jgi:hypothetical protein
MGGGGLRRYQYLVYIAPNGGMISDRLERIWKEEWGHAVALRHYATSRKVAGSIPDEAIG